MKKILLAITIAATFLFLLQKQRKHQKHLKNIYINQFAGLPALNATTQGIVDGLKNAGFEQDKNINLVIESAQGQATLASQISQKFINQNPSVVVGIGTISTQSFIRYIYDTNIPLVFSSVTNPLRAGIVKNIKKSEKNICGVSNFVELKPQLMIFKKLQPSLKKLGFLYNPSESNSRTLAKRMQTVCRSQQIQLILQVANKPSEIAQATAQLAEKVDALFISNDSTALASLPTILHIAEQAQIPVYVSDTDAVSQGALAALGPNQYEIGIQTGAMIARLLHGKSCTENPIEYPKKTELYLNETVARKLNIQIPEEIKNQAQQIIKDQS